MYEEFGVEEGCGRWSRGEGLGGGGGGGREVGGSNVPTSTEPSAVLAREVDVSVAVEW